jgi:hypothetical protein
MSNSKELSIFHGFLLVFLAVLLVGTFLEVYATPTGYQLDQEACRSRPPAQTRAACMNDQKRHRLEMAKHSNCPVHFAPIAETHTSATWRDAKLILLAMAFTVLLQSVGKDLLRVKLCDVFDLMAGLLIVMVLFFIFIVYLGPPHPENMEA